MVRALLVACILSFAVGMSYAQDEPTHTITELNHLLQKSEAGSARVDLLLESALVYIMKPGAEKNDMDSAMFFTNEAMAISNGGKQPAWQARCYRVYSQLYRESNQIPKGKNYIEQAIPILSKYDEKEALGDAYLEMQRYYNVWSDSESVFKIKYAELAAQMYKVSGKKLKQAATLKHLGDFYQIKYKDSIALDRLHEALAVYKSVNYPRVQGVYDLIGNIMEKVGDLNQALKYGLLAVETAEKWGTDDHELSTIYDRVGITCYELNHYQEAGNYFNKAFSIALAIKDTPAIRIIAPNVAEMDLRLGKKQELIAFLYNTRFLSAGDHLADKIYYLSVHILANLLSNDVTASAPLVKQLLQLVGDTTSVKLLRSLHRAVIPYYLAAGNYKEMYKYLPANESICKKFDLVAELADNHLRWFKADSALGNQASALVHYKLYKEASDSAIHQTANHQINQLMIEYETYKKDQSIVSKESNIKLLTNQARLQQEQLIQTRTVRNMTFGLIALLIVILGLLYYAYRVKQRGNRQLRQQQQQINDKNAALQHLVDQKEKLLVDKEWLLKEVHHRVKNNMQMVMSLLNTQSTYLDSDALTAIEESKHRMQAMSLIHQKLYQENNVASINMPAYIRELAGYLRDSYDTGHFIDLNLDLEEIELDVAQAVPVGLILNEAITNTMKYAFPGKERGEINIIMERVSSSSVLLEINDNGIGLPSGQVPGKKHSFGMNLIRGLASQLEGTIHITSGKGLRIHLAFPFNEVLKAAINNGKLTMI